VYTVKKHRKKTKPMMSQLICNMVTNQGASPHHIKMITGATYMQVVGTLNHYQPKQRVTDPESVDGLSRALLSRPMSDWGYIYKNYKSI